MKIIYWSVYTVVYTAISELPKESAEHPKKNYAQLRSNQKGPKGQKDGERVKTPHNPKQQ